MASKLIILSVICFATVIPSVFSGEILFGAKGVVGNMVGDLTAIGAKAAQTKVNALSRAASEIISAGSTAMDKKGQAVVKATSTVVGASIDGISSAAKTVIGAMPQLFMALLGGMSSGSGGLVVETIVPEKPIVVGCKPVNCIQPLHFPAPKPVEVEFEFGRSPAVEVFEPIMPAIVSERFPVWTPSRVPTREVYEYVETPQFFEAGPLFESFRIVKK